MFSVIDTNFNGLKVLETKHFADARGAFRKFFSRDEYCALGFAMDFCEDYYSVNKKDVIRGMHFQIPPCDHEKLVYVTSGRIIDVCLDIRKNSPTYGKFYSIELTADVAKCIYIPKGFAHGFISLEDDTCVHYLQTSCYNKECDRGIRYDSFGFDWSIENPILSERDLSHPRFEDFESPFTGKKVVLTGSTGLIGKEAIEPLKKAGFEVFCLTSRKCNLFDYGAVDQFLEHVKPAYLLHFAWITGGDYLTNPINKDYVDASMNLLRTFKKYGGKRAVFAGTCFEYAFKDEPLKESDPLAPKTLYAQCKVDLNEKASAYCKKNGISFGWGRIFYVYGHNEKDGRLTASILDSLKRNEKVTIKYGQLVRDYMYSKDIAAAFVKFLDSDVQSAVNICTGKGISLGDFAKTIGVAVGKEQLIDVLREKTSQPVSIIGDNSRLQKEVGFETKQNINASIKEVADKYINI